MFISLVNIYDKQVTLVGLHVDFEGQFLFTMDPMNFVLQGSYFNGTRATSFVNSLTQCPDRTSKFTGEYVVDNNQFVTIGEKLHTEPGTG